MEIEKFGYLENEKTFFDEIKSIFHSFWRAIIWWKNKYLMKIADTSFKLTIRKTLTQSPIIQIVHVKVGYQFWWFFRVIVFHVFAIGFCISFSNIKNSSFSFFFRLISTCQCLIFFLILHQSFLKLHPSLIQENWNNDKDQAHKILSTHQ